MKIVKRNSDLVEFDINKITEAICKAMDETELGIEYPLALKISYKIYENYLEQVEYGDYIPSVEEIQDDVEEMLAVHGRFDASKTYILYREKRNQLRSQGWEMTDLQKDIYEQKYKLPNEDFNGFLERVSGGHSVIKKAIRDKKILPAGRILAGRGLSEHGKNVTLSNCYVMPQVEDSIESIFDTAKYLAKTYSYGGGSGLTISKLRPRGAKVQNSAQSTTGSVSFMELYSMVTGLIGQRGRRK